MSVTDQRRLRYYWRLHELPVRPGPSDTLSFYVHDEVGSVIATVTENLGGSNQTLTLNSYDAWGKARPSTGTMAYQDPVPGTFLNPSHSGQHEGYV
jgi:hypothetical protein